MVLQRAADVDDLLARAGAIAARLAQAHADLIALAVELLDGELWSGTGIRSPRHWLVVHAGLSPARAAEILALAGRADELPEAIEAMGAGRLGVDQASVLAHYVPAAYSRQASELAELATVPQLRRALSRYQFAEPEAPDSQAPMPANDRPDSPVASPVDVESEQARLIMHSLDGRFEMRYHAPASIGALVAQAIREAKDALFHAGTVDATLADALAEIANRSLSGIEGTARAAKYRVHVHLDTRGGWLGSGGALPRHLLEQLTCDGVLRPVWETEGTAVNVGRSQRIVPDRTRRLVESRDHEHCRFPGCPATGHTEVHHLTHWRHGGNTDLDGLILLCPHHHDQHHLGAFTISGSPATPDGLTFWARGRWPLRPQAPDACHVAGAAIRLVTRSVGGSADPAPGHDTQHDSGHDTQHDSGHDTQHNLGRDAQHDSGHAAGGHRHRHAEDPTGRPARADGIPWHGPTGERLMSRHLWLAANQPGKASSPEAIPP